MADKVSVIASFVPCSVSDARLLVNLMSLDAEVGLGLGVALGADPEGGLAGGTAKPKAGVTSPSGSHAFSCATGVGLRQVLSRVLGARRISAGDFADVRRILGLSTS